MFFHPIAAQRYGSLHAVVAHSLGTVAAKHAMVTGLPAAHHVETFEKALSKGRLLLTKG